MEPTNTPPPQPEKDETTVVNKKALENLIKKVEMLEAVADVGRVARWQQQHQVALPKIVRITKFKDKYVLAWRLISNEVYKDPVTRAWHENQQMEVIYEDNTKEVFPYQTFMTSCEKVDAQILQSTVDSDGRRTLTVQLNPPEEPRKLTIDSVFVN